MAKPKVKPPLPVEEEKVEKVEKKRNDLSYIITIFKTKKSDKWRISVGADENSFDSERKGWVNAPEIVEIRKSRLNRITGEISAL